MSKSMKWIVTGLALSLAINVFFVGFAIGKRVIGPGSGQAPPTGAYGGLNVRALGQYLSPAEKKSASELLKDNRLNLRDKAGSIRRSERAIRRLLLADSVDRQELSGALDRHEKLLSETHLATRRLVLEFVATLDVETRRAVAEDLFKPRSRPPQNGGDRRPRRRDGPGSGDRPPPPDDF